MSSPSSLWVDELSKSTMRGRGLPQQPAQKDTDFLLSDVVVEKKVVEAQMVPLGTQGNSGNHRDFLSAPLAMIEEGSRASGRPSPDHQGSQQKAAFVGKN